MARVVVTLTIMPESPEADLSLIETATKGAIVAFSGPSEFKVERAPVAFGLVALRVLFVMDEAKGSTEELEKKVALIPHVSSVEVTDVRRTIG